MKRLIALLLCIVLCIGLFPAAAFAEGEPETVEEPAAAEEPVSAEKPAPTGEPKPEEEPETAGEAVPGVTLTLSADRVELLPGETVQITAVTEPADAGLLLTWTSSDEAVLTVDECGLVTAAAAGEAVVTAAAGEVSAELTLTVTEPKSAQTPEPAEQTTVEATAEEMPVLAAAAGTEPVIIASGTCGAQGDNLTWTLDDTGTLTISGTGAMADYDEPFASDNPAPWHEYRNEIKAVLIDGGVTSIGAYAFAECSLTSIEISNSVTSIGNSAFSGCSGLAGTEIPVGVTSIGEYAFAESGLVSVTVPGTAASIGTGAFDWCRNLQNVVISEGVTDVSDSMFRKCSALISVTLPSTLTAIGEDAFGYCSTLTEIGIPASVRSIAGGAFANCFALAGIQVDAANISYRSIDGVLFNKAGTVLHTFPCGINSDSYTVPNTVTTVGSFAFWGSYYLKKVILPRSVTAIEYGGFGSARLMEEIIYQGTEERWNQIRINEYNPLLENVTLTFAPTAPDYTVIFVGTEDAENPNPAEGFSDTAYTLLPAAKTGYTFGGWYKDAAFKKAVKVISAGTTGEVTLYAKWKANSYKVAFNANGGTGKMSAQSMTYGKTAALTANKFKRTGFTFLGWAEEPDAVTPVYTNKQTVSSLTDAAGGTVTLYAVWSCNTYTIRFDANGGDVTGVMADITDLKYETVIRVNECGFSRTGYTFAGFSKTPTGKAAYQLGDAIGRLSAVNGAVVTLYAKWRENTCTVSFDANGGTGKMKNQTLTYGKRTALSANKFKKTGYTFAGWLYNGETYANKAKVANLTAEDGAVVTLTAKWTPIEYKITYKNVLTVENPNSTGYTVEQGVTLQDAARPGCTFEGWFLDSKFKKPALGIEVGSTGNRTFYAKWSGTANKYTVAFDANGGTGTMKLQTMTCGKETALTANKFKRTGYTFAGWLTKDGTPYANKAKVANLTAEDGAAVTLTAQWTPIKYRITYKNIKSTDENPNQKTFTTESQFALETPERPGYTFGGWYTSSKLKAGTEITEILPGRTANLTLYAKWIRE